MIIRKVEIYERFFRLSNTETSFFFCIISAHDYLYRANKIKVCLSFTLPYPAHPGISYRRLEIRISRKLVCGAIEGSDLL